MTFSFLVFIADRQGQEVCSLLQVFVFRDLKEINLMVRNKLGRSLLHLSLTTPGCPASAHPFSLKYLYLFPW